jgi:hypothetical protein
MKSTLRLLPLIPLALLALAACGADASPRGTVQTATATHNSPAVDDVPSSTGFWRTDVAIGGIENQVSPATPVVLKDGSTVTLEALAAGKPLLLYFYATW